LVSCIVVFAGVWVRRGHGAFQLGVAQIGRTASCWAGLQEDSQTFLKDIAFRSITNEISPFSGVGRHSAIATLLVMFFLTSAVCQALFLTSPGHKTSILTNEAQWLRYTEYSFSAGFMVVAILISFGMLDSYLHLAAFALSFVCMATGLAADYARYLSLLPGADAALQKRLRGFSLALHHISWVPVLVTWAILWFVVIDMERGQEVCHNAGGPGLPTWVWAVLVSETVLFLSFGYVQRLQLASQFQIDFLVLRGNALCFNAEFLEPNVAYVPARVGLRTEAAFLVLSLAAKSVLGWIVYSQVLVFA
jgi:hypothetical protein